MRWATMLLAGSILLVTACAEEAPIERAAVVSQGNDICKAGLDEVGEQFEALPKDDRAEAERHVQKEVVGAYRSMVNQLRALGAPEDDAERLDALYADAETGFALIEDRPVATMSGQIDPFPGLDRRFDNFGLSRCDLGTSLLRRG